MGTRWPNGAGYRRLVGWMTLGQGLAYGALWWTDAPLTTSYAHQVELMPLWTWGLVLFVLGCLLLMTAGPWWRRRWSGRLVAAALCGVLAWLVSTFALAGAWTALGQYAPVLVVIFGEAVHWDKSA